MYDELIVGLILLDVGATLAGNWSLWRRIGSIETRLTILETKLACGVFQK